MAVPSGRISYTKQWQGWMELTAIVVGRGTHLQMPSLGCHRGAPDDRSWHIASVRRGAWVDRSWRLSGPFMDIAEPPSLTDAVEKVGGSIGASLSDMR